MADDSSGKDRPTAPKAGTTGTKSRFSSGSRTGGSTGSGSSNVSKSTNVDFLKATARAGDAKSIKQLEQMGIPVTTIKEGPYTRTYVGQQNVERGLQRAQSGSYTDRYGNVRSHYDVIIEKSPYLTKKGDTYYVADKYQKQQQAQQQRQQTAEQIKQQQQQREQDYATALYGSDGYTQQDLMAVQKKPDIVTTREESILDSGATQVTETTTRRENVDEFNKAVREFNQAQRQQEKGKIKEVVSKAKEMGAESITVTTKSGETREVPLERAPLVLTRLGRKEGELEIAITPKRDTSILGDATVEPVSQEKQIAGFIQTAEASGATSLMVTDVGSGKTETIPLVGAAPIIQKRAQEKEIELSFQPETRGVGTRDIFGENVVTSGIDEFLQLDRPISQRSEEVTQIGPIPKEFIAIPSKRATGEFIAPAINIATDVSDFVRATAKGPEAFKEGEFGLPVPKDPTPKYETTLGRVIGGKEVDLTDPNQRISLYGDLAIGGAGLLIGGRIGSKAPKTPKGEKTGEFVGPQSTFGRLAETLRLKPSPKSTARTVAELEYKPYKTQYAVTTTKQKRSFEIEAGTEGRDVLVPKTQQTQPKFGIGPKGEKVAVKPKTQPTVIKEKPVESPYISPEERFGFKIGRSGEKVAAKDVPKRKVPKEIEIPVKRGEVERPFGVVETQEGGLTFLVEKGPRIKAGKEEGLLIVGTKLTPKEAARLGIKAIETGPSGSTIYGGKVTPETRRLIEGALLRERGQKITDISVYPTEAAVKAGRTGDPLLLKELSGTRKTIGVYTFKDLGLYQPKGTSTYNVPVGSRSFDRYLKSLGLYSEPPRASKGFRPFGTGKFGVGETPEIGSAGGAARAKAITDLESARGDIVAGLVGPRPKPTPPTTTQVGRTPIYYASQPADEIQGPSIIEPSAVSRQRPSSASIVYPTPKTQRTGMFGLAETISPKILSGSVISPLDVGVGRKEELGVFSASSLALYTKPKTTPIGGTTQKTTLTPATSFRFSSGNILVPIQGSKTTTTTIQKTGLTPVLGTTTFRFFSGTTFKPFVPVIPKIPTTVFPPIAGGGGFAGFGSLGGREEGYTEVFKLKVINPAFEPLSLKGDVRLYGKSGGIKKTKGSFKKGDLFGTKGFRGLFSL